MLNIKSLFTRFIDERRHRPTIAFEYFISVVITLNAVAAGIMMTYDCPWLEIFDNICIVIFCFELVLRFIASPSAKKFFMDPLQLFDILIIVSCLIPDKFVSDNNVLLGLRVVRLLRITRFIALNHEMSTIIRVLMKSVISLYRVMALMLVFTYVFAVIGMSLFRMPGEGAAPERLAVYQEFAAEADGYFVGDHIDPFGSISESMFSLLKVVSGDDWCNFRNNLLLASQKGVINTPCWAITFYFTIWFIFGAYLLLNLVVGAILQNYEELYSKVHDKNASEERERQINQKVTELVTELVKDLKDGHLSEEEQRILIDKAMNIVNK